MSEMKIACHNCKKEFSTEKDKKGGISIMKGGDEYIYSYFYCKHCNSYTVEEYIDEFITEDTHINSFSKDKKTAEEDIKMIKKCPDAFNKKCKCDVHIKYFCSYT